MKKLLVILLLLLQIPVLAEDLYSSFEKSFDEAAKATRASKGQVASTYSGPVATLVPQRTEFTQKGVYVDGRGQVPEYSRIAPPNPEKVPSVAHPTHTVEPYNSYYQAQVLGWRRPADREPIVPGYNVHYSTRIAKPYTLRNYLDVWCAGTIDYNQNMCSTKGYDIYFVHARNWAARMTTLPFKIKQAKQKGNKVGLFLCVDFVGTDSEHVTDAKRFAALFNLSLFAASIDAYLPLSYFVD